eukprot:363104-Chlamydomonas_euryale.AAC.1
MPDDTYCVRNLACASSRLMPNVICLAGLQRAAWHLDHCANLVSDLDALVFLHAVRNLAQDVNLVLQLVVHAHQRHHQLRVHRDTGLDHVSGGVEDGRRLHLCDTWVHDAKAAAAQAHHRVGLAQALQACVHNVGLHTQLSGNLLAQIAERRALMREEFVQRWVQQADGDRQAVHGVEDALEVFTLVLLQLLEGVGLGWGVQLHRRNHAPHGRDALRRAEEHVLRACQANALGAVGTRHLCVLGRVGVGPHLQAPVPHQCGVLHRLLAQNDLTRCAVKAQPLALLDDHRDAVLTVNRHLLKLVVYAQRLAAAHTRLAPTARHHSSVARHAAARRADALCRVHAADILGRGLDAAQDDLLAACVPLLSVLGIEHNAANGGARRCSQARGQHVARLHNEHGLLFRQDALFDHVHRNLERGGARAFAVACLQHEQPALLHRELAVLHVFHVQLKFGGDVQQLLVDCRHACLQLGHRQRRTDACDHVLALRVEQELAEQLALARGRVACETHAGAGILHRAVAKHHGLHVDGCALESGDLMKGAILDGTRGLPRAEHRVDAHAQLLPR